MKGSSEGVPQEASDDDENQSNIQNEDDDNGEHKITSSSGQNKDIENNEMGHNQDDNSHEISFFENRKGDYKSLINYLVLVKSLLYQMEYEAYFKMWKDIIQAHPNLGKMIFFEVFLLQM